MKKIKITTRSFNDWKLKVLCVNFAEAINEEEKEKLKNEMFAHLLKEKEVVNA